MLSVTKRSIIVSVKLTDTHLTKITVPSVEPKTSLSCIPTQVRYRTSSFQSTPCFLRSILMLSHLSLTNKYSLQVSRLKMLLEFLNSPMHAKYATHLILLHLVTRKKHLVKTIQSVNFSLCTLLRLSLISLRAKIFSALFSQTSSMSVLPLGDETEVTSDHVIQIDG